MEAREVGNLTPRDREQLDEVFERAYAAWLLGEGSLRECFWREAAKFVARQVVWQVLEKEGIAMRPIGRVW